MGKASNVIIGLIWVIIGIAILSMTWSWIVILGNLFTDDFYYALYYVSVIAMIAVCIFIPPIVLIIDAFQIEVQE